MTGLLNGWRVGMLMKACQPVNRSSSQTMWCVVWGVGYGMWCMVWCDGDDIWIRFTKRAKPFETIFLLHMMLNSIYIINIFLQYFAMIKIPIFSSSKLFLLCVYNFGFAFAICFIALFIGRFLLKSSISFHLQYVFFYRF